MTWQRIEREHAIVRFIDEYGRHTWACACGAAGPRWFTSRQGATMSHTAHQKAQF